MTAIERAKSHFKMKMAQELQGPIHVPEWEMDIYYRGSMSMAQQAQILELHQQNKLSEAAVMLLIIRALDADGNHIFVKADRTELMRSVDSEVISRIVGQISSGDDSKDPDLGN